MIILRHRARAEIAQRIGSMPSGRGNHAGRPLAATNRTQGEEAMEEEVRNHMTTGDWSSWIIYWSL